ncbi:MAG: GAF domain-containing protein [Planctomycetes bacterium]|nr:GAF domain-containing protein [Planctomycetota bacterium]
MTKVIEAPESPASAGPASQLPSGREAALAQFRRARGADESPQAYLAEAARLAAEALEVEFLGVAQISGGDGGLSLYWTRADGDPNAADAKELTFDPNASAWAFALDDRQTLVIADLDREARFYDATLHEADVASGVVCPIFNGDESVAAVGVFSSQPRQFTDEEREFLASLMKRAAAGLTPLEKDLGELVVRLSPAGAIQEINDACRHATGFELSDVEGKRLWESLFPEDQAPIVQEAFDELRQGEASIRIECPLRTRDGGSRTVAWSFTIIQREDGRLQAVVGKGVEPSPEPETAAPQSEEAPVADSEEAQATLSELEGHLREGRLPPPELLEQLIDIQRGGQQKYTEKRTRARRLFPYVQRVAAWAGGRLPRPRDFLEVQCRDISATGFSFFVERRPRYDRIVVAFGPDENPVHVVAEVRHVTPHEPTGDAQFIVGCEFLARVQY